MLVSGEKLLGFQDKLTQTFGVCMRKLKSYRRFEIIARDCGIWVFFTWSETFESRSNRFCYVDLEICCALATISWNLYLFPCVCVCVCACVFDCFRNLIQFFPTAAWQTASSVTVSCFRHIGHIHPSWCVQSYFKINLDLFSSRFDERYRIFQNSTQGFPRNHGWYLVLSHDRKGTNPGRIPNY